MASKGPKTGVKTPAVQAPKPRAVKPTAPVAKAVAAKAPAAKAAVQAIAAKPAVVAQPPVAAKPIVTQAVKPAPAPAAKIVAPVVKAVEAVVEASVPVIESAKKATTTAAATTAETAKETIIMATQFEAPKVFADMNDRAKAAMEKSGKIVEEFNDFAKGNVEAVVESSRIAAKGFETIGQEAAEYSRKSFEGFTTTLKSLASVKSPADFFKLQSDYIRSSFDSAVAEASKGTETMIKLAGDAAQPLSNRFAVAAEKVKTAA